MLMRRQRQTVARWWRRDPPRPGSPPSGEESGSAAMAVAGFSFCGPVRHWLAPAGTAVSESAQVPSSNSQHVLSRFK